MEFLQPHDDLAETLGSLFQGEHSAGHSCLDVDEVSPVAVLHQHEVVVIILLKGEELHQVAAVHLLHHLTRVLRRFP